MKAKYRSAAMKHIKNTTQIFMKTTGIKIGQTMNIRFVVKYLVKINWKENGLRIFYKPVLLNVENL